MPWQLCRLKFGEWEGVAYIRSINCNILVNGLTWSSSIRFHQNAEGLNTGTVLQHQNMLPEKYHNCLGEDQCNISREPLHYSWIQVLVAACLLSCSVLMLVRCAPGQHARDGEKRYLNVHLPWPWRCEHFCTSKIQRGFTLTLCTSFTTSVSSCWSFCAANYPTDETQALYRKFGTLLVVWSAFGRCWNGKQCINCIEGPYF